MARRPDLERFAEKHQLKIGTITDLIHYRIANEHTVTRQESHDLDTEFGVFQLHTYNDSITGSTHLAFTRGEIDADDPVLVRVHIPNTLRDLCQAYNASGTSWSFSKALEKIALEGKGVAVLLSGDDYAEDIQTTIAGMLDSERSPGPGSRTGTDLTIGTGSQILRDLGVGKMRLLSYPARFAISGFDLEVVEFVPFEE